MRGPSLNHDWLVGVARPSIAFFSYATVLELCPAWRFIEWRMISRRRATSFRSAGRFWGLVFTHSMMRFDRLSGTSGFKAAGLWIKPSNNRLFSLFLILNSVGNDRPVRDQYR